MSNFQGIHMLQLLVHRVTDQLRERGAQDIDVEGLRHAMREVLFYSSIRPEEAVEVRARRAQNADDTVLLEAFIEMRVEAALKVGLARASKQCGVPVPSAPRVVVHRPGIDDGVLDERIAKWMDETMFGVDTAGAALLSIDMDDVRDVLVLANNAALDGLLERHGDLRIGEHSFGVLFPAGVDQAVVALGTERVGPMQMMEFSTAFRELEATLRAAMDGLEDADPGRTLDATLGATLADAQSVPRHAPIGTGTLLGGKYEITHRIGRGGFGTVFEARDVRLDHRVAIKVLNARGDDGEASAFRDEARRLTKLNHPNIVDWKAFDETEDGTSYFVLELLEGQELTELLREGEPLPPARAGAIVSQTLDALRSAHASSAGQVLHLDLKPGNLFLVEPPAGREGDWVKVIDFGIGQISELEETSFEAEGAGAADDEEGPGSSLRAAVALPDQRGVVRCSACTPEYAAPEQGAHLLPEVEIAELDGRADLYAVGVIAYQLLTGKLPYELPDERRALLYRKLEQPAQSVAASGVAVPRRLAAFVERLLEVDRERRYADADEAWRVLQRILHPLVTGPRVAALALAAALVAGLLWLLWPEPHGSFDLSIAGAEGLQRSVEDEVLYFGPQRPEVRLSITGLEAAPETARGARLLTRRDPRAPVVVGWNARIEGVDLVLTRAPQARQAAEREELPAFVELEIDAGLRYSVPFDLVWLGPQAWGFESVDVAGRAERAVDPEGSTLEIALRARPADLESVQLRYAAQTLRARPDPSRSDDEHALYLLPLGPLGAPDGVLELEVEARDRAGRRRTRHVRFELARTRLGFRDTRLNASLLAGKYWLAAGEPPTLSFELSRRADLVWSLTDERGQELARGTRLDTSAGAIELELPASLLRGGETGGTIDVRASDEAYVARAEGSQRGRAAAQLAFVYSDERPELALRVGRDDGDFGRVLHEGERLWSATPEVSIHIARQNDVPLDVALRLVPRTDEGYAEERALDLGPRPLVDAERSTETFAVTLPGAGEWRVEARAWRHVEGQPEREPDASVHGTLVVDRSPPRVTRDEAAPALVLTDVADGLHAVLAPEDEGPVSLRYELRGGSDAASSLRSGWLAEDLEPGPSRSLALPLPWSAESAGGVQDSVDGHYRVRLEPVDAAGNVGPELELEYDVALEGPALELHSPPDELTWDCDAAGLCELVVLARDPNGVAGVTARVTREGGTTPLALDALEPRDAGRTVWSARVELPADWAESRVTIEVRARDAFERTTELVQARELGALLRSRAPRLEVRLAGVPVAGLALVRGNHGVPYVFGGRPDEEEERLFREAGLGPYNRLRTPKSWRVTYEPGEIRDFYLDEHEVSAAEFLAFLEAEGAFPGEAERRAALRAELRTLDPRDAARGMTRDEAEAYARWVGKRLPSIVEWEYALRGGVLYRPHAAWRAGSLDPGAPDRTPQGHLCLSGGVSEWTSSPASFDPEDPRPRDLAEHLARHRRALLDPRLADRPLDTFWVAGASSGSPRRDFSVVDRRARSFAGASVGFRCALDADAVEARDGDSGPELVEVWE